MYTINALRREVIRIEEEIADWEFEYGDNIEDEEVLDYIIELKDKLFKIRNELRLLDAIGNGARI